MYRCTLLLGFVLWCLLGVSAVRLLLGFMATGRWDVRAGWRGGLRTICLSRSDRAIYAAACGFVFAIGMTGIMLSLTGLTGTKNLLLAALGMFALSCVTSYIDSGPRRRKAA